MKSAMFALLAAVLITGVSGCQTLGGKCDSCDGGCSADCAGDDCGGSCGTHARLRPMKQAVDYPDPGPSTPQVTYPYYTTRGPRDYFSGPSPDLGP